MVKLNKSCLTSFGLSIFLFSPVLSLLIPINGIVVSCVLTGFFVSIIAGGLKKINIYVFGMIFLSFIVFFISDPNEYWWLYFLSFGVFGVFGMLLSSLDFNLFYLYRFSFFFSIAAFFFIFKVVWLGYVPTTAIISDNRAGFYMVVSQKVAPVTLILLGCFFYDSNKFIRYCSFGVFVFLMFFILFYGPRSLGLSFLIFFVFLVLRMKGILNFLSMFCLLVFCFFISFVFYDIIYALNSIFEILGFESRSLSRMLQYRELGGDASSGRFDLWSTSLKHFSDNPLLGNGVGTFEINYGYYTHNFLLQALYEGGFFLFFAMLFAIFKFSQIFFSRKISHESWFFIVAIFFGGVFYLLFSSVFWRSHIFWFFIGFVLSYKPASFTRTLNGRPSTTIVTE